MRYVIFGAGAIGGLVGGRLHQSGHEVALIARGSNYKAIAERGLKLRKPGGDVTLAVPVFSSLVDAQLRAGDVVLLCTKSQDTRDSLDAVRSAADSTSLPIVCLQNGVENEREALRRFANVYGATVLIPAEHLNPGEVLCYSAELDGRIDVGRYPEGTDATTSALSTALRKSNFDSDERPNIMVHKYAKLLNNLYNAIDGVCGMSDPDGNRALSDRAQAEGREVLTAAGIEHDVPEIRETGERWTRMTFGEIDGHTHRGSSTWQSVKRGLGSAEVDYLTGEIVLIARQHGHPAPVNALLAQLLTQTVNERREPGWLTASDVLARLS